VLYSHYDVQPANPIADWSHDPFGANIEGDVIYARGICDDKADIASRLHAIQVWRDANGELPFDVVWLSEGAEEIGSPGLAAACSEHSEQLRGDGCLWESYLRRADGRPEIAFGCKGLLYVELSLRALASDQHSSYAGVFRSAPIRLVQALATLVGPDGRPRIDGFEGTYDEPSTEELRQLDLLELPDGTAASQTGKTPFQDSCSREDLLKRLFLEPSVNISGLASGFQGAGSKTIIPASAGAKVDFRLIQNQSPEMVASLLESHLASRGFDDIVVETLSAVRGAQSDRNSVIGKSVLQAACEVMGAPIVYPIVPGSGPMHVIVEGLKTPTVTGPGSLRMDSGIHGPDEHIRVTDYQDEI
jgi:acetylornithine deacetylase/succinyl-diaminopimelate desuccinylase-like protein